MSKPIRLITGTAKKTEGPKPWELRGRREDGAQYRERFRTKGEMEDYDRALADRKSRLKRGLPEESKPVTYKQLVDIVLAQENGGGSVWKREMLAYSLAHFGPDQVRRIQSHEVGRWINSLTKTKVDYKTGARAKTETPLSGKTKQHILATMRSILERGVVQGFLDVNPARAGAVKPPTASAPDVYPFESWTEIYSVAEQAGTKFGPMIRFACATGLRPEEYLALTWNDIDRQDCACHVRRTVVDGKVKDSGKTVASLRTIVLTDQAIAALDALPAPLRRDQLVFSNTKGAHLNLNNLRNRVWHKAVASAGLTPRPLYQTRHSFATLALEATGDLAWVSHQLGHTDIQITRKCYARYMPGIHARNLAKLNGAWGSDAGVSETCHEDVR